jgi:hypothetical protein
MTFMRSYSISKVNLQVKCDDELLGKKVIGAINNHFFMTRNDSTPHYHNITLKFKNNNTSIKIPETAHELSTSSSLRVLKDGDFCYLIKEDSVSQLDLVNSMGVVSISPTFWRKPIKSQQEFLMLSLLWLLRQHGIYALHANGLVKESGILFVGGSGSGKSTSSLSLIRQGWSYLSDDVILLRNSLDGIEDRHSQKDFHLIRT